MARNLSQLARIAVREALADGITSDPAITAYALEYVTAHQQVEAAKAVAAAVRATKITGAN